MFGLLKNSIISSFCVCVTPFLPSINNELRKNIRKLSIDHNYEINIIGFGVH